MILEMNRCIANQQKSGQGEGAIDDADNEMDNDFGSLAIWSQQALATRHFFLRPTTLSTVSVRDACSAWATAKVNQFCVCIQWVEWSSMI